MASLQVAPKLACYTKCTSKFLHKSGVPEASISCRHDGRGVYLASGDLLQHSGQHRYWKEEETEGGGVGRKSEGLYSAPGSPRCGAAAAIYHLVTL